MVAEEQNAALRADPVKSLAIDNFFSEQVFAELHPVAALEFADLTKDVMVFGAPDRAATDQCNFLDLDTVVDAVCDLQFAIRFGDRNATDVQRTIQALFVPFGFRGFGIEFFYARKK